MAEIAGKMGAIYYRKARMQGTGIAFVDSDPDTITDSGDGFETAGFEAGDYVTVSGSTNNDGTYLVGTVAAGTLTLDAGESLTAEGAGATITIVEALPGTEVAGFFNWTLNDGNDVVDATDFGDSGKRTYLSTLQGWTATAEKHWLTTGNQETWLGTKVRVRFFVQYSSDPTATTVYYYEGSAFITGISVNTPVGDIVNATLEFQGDVSAKIEGTGIAFVDSDPDTITDSGNGFFTAGFDEGDQIEVSGSTDNDGNYTIVTVEAGTLTLHAGDSLAAEAAGDHVKITTPQRSYVRTTAWPTQEKGNVVMDNQIISDVIVSDIDVDIRGKTYTFTPLTIGDLADFETHIRAQKLKACMEVAKDIEDPDTQKMMIQSAMSESLSAEEVQNATQSVTGVRFFLYRRIKTHHPEITLDNVGQLCGLDNYIILTEIVFSTEEEESPQQQRVAEESR